MNKQLLIATAGILLIVFASVAITVARSKNHKFKFQQIQLQNRDSQLKLEQIKSKTLNERLNDGQVKSEQEIQKLQQEIEQRKQNEERLERDLQAKLAEKQRIASAQESLVNRVTATQTASASSKATFGGDKQSWLQASGIPSDQWGAVDSIVSRESSWNPNAVNVSSGACGLGQQFPCGKWAGAWNDPVMALKAQYGYVNARYGGYPQAVAFWNANHWY